MSTDTNPFDCLNQEQVEHLSEYIDIQLQRIEEPDSEQLTALGLNFPTQVSETLTNLPDQWDDLMEVKGIVGLEDYELEDYLEKWLRLIGFAKWIQGLRETKARILEDCANYVSDYVHSHAKGGREQKAAVSGSHPLYKRVMDELTKAREQLSIINGLVFNWEKIEFSISRAITNRQGKPMR